MRRFEGPGGGSYRRELPIKNKITGKTIVKGYYIATNQELSDMSDNLNPMLSTLGGQYIPCAAPEFDPDKKRNLCIINSSLTDFLFSAKYWIMCQAHPSTLNIYHSIDVLKNYYLGEKQIADLATVKLVIIIFDCHQKNAELGNVMHELIGLRSNSQETIEDCHYPTWIFCPYKKLSDASWEYTEDLAKIVHKKFIIFKMEGSESKVISKTQNLAADFKIG